MVCYVLKHFIRNINMIKYFTSINGDLMTRGVFPTAVAGGGVITTLTESIYFIPSAKWGIEMIFEDDHLSGHCRKFQTGGAYHDWIKTKMMH
jgi:hypothetical protein